MDSLIVGLAATYIWYVAAHLNPPLIKRPLVWLRESPARTLISCPWCLGFWVTGLLTLTLHSPLTASFYAVWLASAAIAGIVGTLLPDDGEPT